MSRRFEVALCFVLFTAIMFALRAGLHATVPDLIEWASSKVGEVAVFAVVMAFTVPALAFSIREHCRDVSARRLRRLTR